MMKEIFPSGIEETYCIPYKPATEGSKKVGAKGKFVEEYEQFWGLLIECELTKFKKGLKQKLVDYRGVLRLGRSEDLSEGIKFLHLMTISDNYNYIKNVIYISSNKFMNRWIN